jgi:hypothetical protein
VRSAVTALLVARVLRPSYSWLLGWRDHGTLRRAFWQVNEAEAWARLQALPGWTAALPGSAVTPPMRCAG